MYLNILRRRISPTKLKRDSEVVFRNAAKGKEIIGLLNLFVNSYLGKYKAEEHLKWLGPRENYIVPQKSSLDLKEQTKLDQEALKSKQNTSVKMNNFLEYSSQIEPELKKSDFNLFEKKTKELIRLNINKMTTWSTDDKVSAYVIIDKYINTEKDKKEFISLIMKLKKEELVDLFGDISKAVVFPLSVVDNNKNLNQKNTKKKKNSRNSTIENINFLKEELEFLKEEHILVEDFDSKWSWLTNELAEKYFISVLLPYYIVEPSLAYEKLNLLGFRNFCDTLKRKKIYFSVIKDKYLNLDPQKLIKILIEKIGADKANNKIENAKKKLKNFIKTISRSTIARSKRKLKLILDLGFSQTKCQECNIGVDLLVALQLHHPTESKEIQLNDIYKKSIKEYNLILEKFKNDKVELLCKNHHLEKQVFYPIIFKDIIFKEDLFSMSAEKIYAYIDNYLNTFAKTEKYKEILYEKYTSNNKEVPYDIKYNWKEQIKKWIKKRFVFKELFDGKCVVCGDSNLLHLGLHHIISDMKDLIEIWQSIAKLDCDEIMRLIIKEKCVCLCSNCHALITFKYYLYIREILKGFFTQQEIDKFSEEIMLKYNDAIERISNFKYDIKKINFKCPLKLDFSHKEAWKIHLITIYYYLKIKEKSFFFRNEILYDLGLFPPFIKVSIKKLIDIGYVRKFGSLLKYSLNDLLSKYSLTEKGLDKSLSLIQEYKNKANKIEGKIKEFLKNKGKFDFLDYTFSHDDKNLIHKKRYSDEEIKLKYCLIIFDLISKKGVNEFTAKELIPYFNFKYTYNAIWINLTSKLLSSNLIEEVYVDTQRKIFKFTEKGFNFVENGFESES